MMKPREFISSPSRRFGRTNTLVRCPQSGRSYAISPGALGGGARLGPGRVSRVAEEVAARPFSPNCSNCSRTETKKRLDEGAAISPVAAGF
jgi:hypothetical protein